MYCPECGKKLPVVMSVGDMHNYVCKDCSYIWEWNPFQLDTVGYSRYDLDDDTELLVNLEEKEQQEWQDNLEKLLK